MIDGVFVDEQFVEINAVFGCGEVGSGRVNALVLIGVLDVGAVFGGVLSTCQPTECSISLRED